MSGLLRRPLVQARRRYRREIFFGKCLIVGMFLCIGIFTDWFVTSNQMDSELSNPGRTLHATTQNKNLECDFDARFIPASESFENTLKGGSLLFYGAGILYMFIGLAIVCDDYFVASLEVISEKLKLSENVAGATFMAAGSSAPELFTSIISVFGPQNDMGAGTIVGSAVFNVLVIIGGSAIYAGQVLYLDWKPLSRDCFFYSVSIVLLVTFFLDEGDHMIHWWEAIIFIIVYVGYVVFLAYDELIWTKLGNLFPKQYQNAFVIATEESGTFDASLDEELIENEDLVEKAVSLDDDDEKPIEEVGEDDDDDEKPTTILGWIWYYIVLPYQYAFYYTIPNCGKKQWERWYVVTFVMSIFWIGFLSYFMVEWATRAGCYLNIDSAVMGVTILAAGTSIPDAMGSFLVAKHGKGDMAVSNAIGSNIFDILVGLGTPWCISTIFLRRTIVVSSNHIFEQVLILFGVLFLAVGSIAINKWKMGKKIGIMFCVVYGLFVFYTVLSGWLKVIQNFDKINQ